MVARSLILAVALWPATVLSQGIEVIRRDPTKPRDGFGFALQAAISGGSTAAGAAVTATAYPIITKITAGTPADSAGLRVGDEILAIDDRDVIQERVRFDPPAGTSIRLRFRRGSEILEAKLVSVRLYTPPDPD